ncbi:MAG: crossover junction endodeoxyribonuclease RuvC [Runella slithyformis]|jgi:crossover junction endodeoxyribonuclease RuvC|nr:MAG: crossover junction endodeoxyribonuclease RuvC [Runella slithyformis]TAF31615.1 MAG: crossover junction endodeoxyribonuclease RuvC [Cytophagales bacterium]TAF94545.1 MAG: crossover junction endodeoxyribonuclease RuvC [Runella sp.]TAG39481.1 MAG: crossover junction endodeoxyribonuclease RuvC [Cytophagia bacterium]TAF79410.1 MAG: crossover junction endodeoxyribonuclease RuvC [Runella slithyformis]
MQNGLNNKNGETPTYEKIILGVDPGTQIAGYGVIKITGQRIDLLQYGVLKLGKYSTYQLKLQKIFERITQLIDEFLPDEMAIEDPFYGKNPQSMLKLGRAQGVAMAAALSRNIPIVEYSPKSVKKSVTGSGSASKEQVAYMLQSILKQELRPEFFDATDAVAIAICHHYHANSPSSVPSNGKKSSKKGGWGAFVSENPNRVK